MVIKTRCLKFRWTLMSQQAKMFSIPNQAWMLMAHYHQRVPVGSVGQGGSRFANQKWAPHLGYWDAWKGASKFELHTPPLGRQQIVSTVRQGDNNQQTHYPQGISVQRRKLSLLKQTSRKSWTLLGRPTLLLIVYCTAFFIFLGFIRRLYCVGLLWGHNAYVAAAAILIWL